MNDNNITTTNIRKSCLDEFLAKLCDPTNNPYRKEIIDWYANNVKLIHNLQYKGKEEFILYLAIFHYSGACKYHIEYKDEELKYIIKFLKNISDNCYDSDGNQISKGLGTICPILDEGQGE